MNAEHEQVVSELKATHQQEVDQLSSKIQGLEQEGQALKEQVSV